MNGTPYRMTDPKDEEIARLREELVRQRAQHQTEMERQRAQHQTEMERQQRATREPSWFAAFMWWCFILAWMLLFIGGILVCVHLWLRGHTHEGIAFLFALDLAAGAILFLVLHRRYTGKPLID